MPNTLLSSTKAVLFRPPLLEPKAPLISGIETHPLIGWKEWVTLPAFGGMRLRAKVDTGARTSALHVENLELVRRDNRDMAVFSVPQGKFGHREVLEIIDFRLVTDSGGHAETRPFVRTTVRLGSIEWEVEVSLTNRAAMRYSMLLGRKALANRFVVHPTSAYLWKRPRKLNL